jgi:ribonuclease HI
LRTRRVKVYVDAKILHTHEKGAKREAFVGYYVDDKVKGAKKVEAEESDDAEVLAILFAIERLQGLGKLVVVCDHQSVVSEAKRDVVKDPSELMAKLRKTLSQNPSVSLEVLKANPAHGVVTQYVNELEALGE